MMVDRKRHAWLVAFTKFSQKISTHLLTVLILGVITVIEQRKGNKRKVPKASGSDLTSKQIVLRIERMDDLC